MTEQTSPMVDGTDIVVEQDGELWRYRRLSADDWEALRWEDFGWDWHDNVGYATVCESVLTADAVFVAAKDEQ